MLALEAASFHLEVPQALPQVRGYLPLAAWDPFLSSLPERAFARFLRREIIHGFRAGVPPNATALSMPS